jgi:hypothetical protein
MLLASIGVVFIAAAFQIYLANRTVQRTLTDVHARLMAGHYAANNQDTEHSTEASNIIWSSSKGFDVRPPRLGLFQEQLPVDWRIYSNSGLNAPGQEDSECEPTSPPCKRTKGHGGLKMDLFVAIGEALGELGDGYFDWLGENFDSAALDALDANAIADMQDQIAEAAACAQDAEECMREYLRKKYPLLAALGMI